MTLVSPTDAITAISDKLIASGALPSGTTLWYPSAPPETVAPFAVISATGSSRKIAEGSSSIVGGSGMVILWAELNEGELESVAQNICDYLSGNSVGLHISEASYDMALEVEDNAPDETAIPVLITFTYGLGA